MAKFLNPAAVINRHLKKVLDAAVSGFFLECLGFVHGPVPDTSCAESSKFDNLFFSSDMTLWTQDGFCTWYRNTGSLSASSVESLTPHGTNEYCRSYLKNRFSHGDLPTPYLGRASLESSYSRLTA